MVNFPQPINRENALKAILDGYESCIDNEWWLAEAFQKDAIQNCWDARTNDKGKGWRAEIKYIANEDLLVVEDSGTTGLTGEIPEDYADLIRILQEADERDCGTEEKISSFLSSDWSGKSRSSLGSRGRGKMLFVASSDQKRFSFETLQYDSGQYIFGNVYLDKTKQVLNEYHCGNEGRSEQGRQYKSAFMPISKPGTRIIIPRPTKLLKRSLFDSDGITLIELIQKTWWEILCKCNANIIVDVGNSLQSVPKSPWLPVREAGVSIVHDSTNIPIKSQHGLLRIKRISLGYLGEKEIPKGYTGISIQRDGMSVQRLQTKEFIDDIRVAAKVFGSIELDSDLSLIMKNAEGPEHCSFKWNAVPHEFRRSVEREIKQFLQKHGLLEGDHAKVAKKQRATESRIENYLNDLSKKLKLPTSGSGHKIKPREQESRGPDKPLRLSMASFDGGQRVDWGQQLRNAFVEPVNETNSAILVLVKLYIFHGDRLVKEYEQRINLLPSQYKLVGWPSINIERAKFSKGKYILRGRLIALEDSDIKTEIAGEIKRIKKADRIYEISKPFYVEEDPPSVGLFRVERTQYPTPTERHIWLDTDVVSEGYVLRYNGLHPELLSVIEHEDMLFDHVIKSALQYVYALCLEADLNRVKNKEKPVIFTDCNLVADRQIELWKLLNLMNNKRSLDLSTHNPKR